MKGKIRGRMEDENEYKRLLKTRRVYLAKEGIHTLTRRKSVVRERGVSKEEKICAFPFKSRREG